MTRLAGQATECQRSSMKDFRYVHLALFFMVPFPRSPLALLAMIRTLVSTKLHSREVLAFEQYLTALQETHINSLMGVRNGSFESTEAKQLSHVSTADSLHQD